MNKAKYMEEETIIRKGIGALLKELNPVEVMRFINISREDRTESVKRHREWQKLLDKDKFFDEIFSVHK
ncbi:MAG: hypothetical protein ACYDB5_10665 [bacterium]